MIKKNPVFHNIEITGELQDGMCVVYEEQKVHLPFSCVNSSNLKDKGKRQNLPVFFHLNVLLSVALNVLAQTATTDDFQKPSSTGLTGQ